MVEVGEGDLLTGQAETLGTEAAERWYDVADQVTTVVEMWSGIIFNDSSAKKQIEATEGNGPPLVKKRQR